MLNGDISILFHVIMSIIHDEGFIFRSHRHAANMTVWVRTW